MPRKKLKKLTRSANGAFTLVTAQNHEWSVAGSLSEDSSRTDWVLSGDESSFDSDALKLLDMSLDACTVTIIQRFFQCVHQYICIYGQGATGILAEFAVRKYRLHRGVSIKDLAEAKTQKDERDAELFSTRNGKEKILD